MPRLMEKEDWLRTVSDFGNLDRVWLDDVSGDTRAVSLSLPETGSYRIFMVKVRKNGQEECHADACNHRDLLDVPVSSRVRRLVGIIPDEHPEKNYSEIISDAIAERHGIA